MDQLKKFIIIFLSMGLAQQLNDYFHVEPAWLRIMVYAGMGLVSGMIIKVCIDDKMNE